MHRVSDQLNDRHPYLDLPFQESYDPKQVHRPFGARAISKYAELLVMDDLPDEDRARALAELHELLSNQETKAQAVDREVMFACADLADASAATVRANAARVMSSLVLYANDQGDELSTEAMLRAATALLGDREDEVVLAACAVFRNATVSNEGALLLAGRLEVVGKIAGMINSQPLKTVAEPLLREVLGVLANVTRVYEGAQTCAECSITAPVLAVLKKCALYDAETVHAAALILGNAATHDQGKRLAIHQGGVEICLSTLSKVLQAKPTFHKCDAALHVELTRSLVGAVMGLSTVEDAKPRIVEFGVDPLVACLHHVNTSIKTNACIAINSACEAPRGVAAFVAKLLPECDLLVEVLGAKSVPALLPFVKDVDDDAKTHALRALQELTRSDDGVKAVVQCLNLLDALIEALVAPSASSRAIHDLALAVLQHTAARGGSYTRRVGNKLRKLGVAAPDFDRVIGEDMATFVSRVDE